MCVEGFWVGGRRGWRVHDNGVVTIAEGTGGQGPESARGALLEEIYCSFKPYLAH